MKKNKKISKKKNKIKEEYEIKWWKDWLESDILKREEMVAKLPIIQSIWDLNNLPKEMKERMFAQNLNGFFEDLESAVYVRTMDAKK